MIGQLRILIAVTHLLGIGHLARMAALARALKLAGHAVRLISGGRAAPILELNDVDLVQLPPVHCRGTNFTQLLMGDDEPASSQVLSARIAVTIAALIDFAPDIVITELYPFGRRALRGEFAALVAAARGLKPPPAILASVRDVLNPPAKPGRAAEVLATLGAGYDAILVHGDREALPLDASWPVEPALHRRLRYCGYLRHAIHDRQGPVAARAGIVVSGGGSSAGLALFTAAIGAAGRVSPAISWRILVGHGVPDTAFAALAASAPPQVIVERARPDFTELLAGAALSISQAGYNTVLDLAAAGPRAILVPFAEGHEQEQTIRAGALASRGLATMIPAAALDAPRLARAVTTALAQPPADWSSIPIDGADRAVAAIAAVAADRRAIEAGWLALDAALRRAEQSQIALKIWLRDDDAVADSAALGRFFALIDRFALPVALAAIPARATASLVARCQARAGTDLLVHGFAHLNHAPVGAKAAEFGGHRGQATERADLAEALGRLLVLAGDLALPIFVPPWNRIAAETAAMLAPLGYRGLSTFAAAHLDSTAPGGIPVANCHWDPIAWRKGGGLRAESVLLEELASLIDARIDAAEPLPIGLLTHHLVHDGWIDRFLAELFERLCAAPAIRFVTAREVFARTG